MEESGYALSLSVSLSVSLSLCFLLRLCMFLKNGCLPHRILSLCFVLFSPSLCLSCLPPPVSPSHFLFLTVGAVWSCLSLFFSHVVLSHSMSISRLLSFAGFFTRASSVLSLHYVCLSLERESSIRGTREVPVAGARANLQVHTQTGRRERERLCIESKYLDGHDSHLGTHKNIYTHTYTQCRELRNNAHDKARKEEIVRTQRGAGNIATSMPITCICMCAVTA